MYTADKSDAALKVRLEKARRSGGGTIPESDKRMIRDLIKHGTSKKAVCTIYGLTYSELKEQLK